jgi:hypothetical protein
MVAGDGMGFWQSIAVSVALTALITLFLVRLAAPERKVRRARDVERGLIECAIRFPKAFSGSLGSMWQPGIAEVNAGTMKFQPVYDVTLSNPSGPVKVFSDVHASATWSCLPKSRRS